MSEEVVELVGLVVVGGIVYFYAQQEGINIFSPPGGSTFDKYGVRNIFATAGTTYYNVVNSDNPELNRREWEIPGQALNQEVTVYVYLKSGKDTVSIKMRGSDHNDTHPTYGCCYIVEVPFPNTGVRNNNLQKECPHGSGNYCGQRTPTQGNISNMYNRWVGIKAISANMMWNGKKAVRLIAGLDYGNSNGSKPGNLWRTWFDMVDYGSFANCNTSALKPPFTRSPWGGGPPKVFIRIDNSPGAQIKWASVREITGPNIIRTTGAEQFTSEVATVRPKEYKALESRKLERTPIF